MKSYASLSDPTGTKTERLKTLPETEFENKRHLQAYNELDRRRGSEGALKHALQTREEKGPGGTQ